MRAMRNLRQRGKSGVWYVVMDIPPEARPSFEGRSQVWMSLRTTSHTQALREAGPIVAGLKERIAAARAGRGPNLRAALERLADVTLSGSFFAYKEEMEVGSVSGTPREPWLDRGFDELLLRTLVSEGMQVTRDDPRLSMARETFIQIWTEMDKANRVRFAQAMRLDRRRFEALPRAQVTTALQAPLSEHQPLLLSGLRDRFLTARGIEGKDASEVRAYVRRLIEFTGDVPITEVTPEKLDRFKTALRRFPVVRRPEVAKQSFTAILAAYEHEVETARLTTATIRRKWFGAFNRMFNYAVELELVDRNPVTKVIPKKAEEEMAERKPFSPADIAKLFSAPLFTGHSGQLHGYRKKAGAAVIKDAPYWLPIIALWHGMRVEEIGGMKAADVRREEGVWVFDLTGRDLKTAESRRLVPVHPKLIELGIVAHARAQKGGWLFPDLPHDPDGKKAATRAYTSWFGRWCDAHGLTDPATSFHSFRHTFKRACRDAGITEELHDLITGHKGQASVGRSYGRGASIGALTQAIKKVDFPTFRKKLP